MSNGKTVVYKHNDLSDLESKLRKKNGRKFIITEGVFSMDGDFADLKNIAKIAESNNAILILDDAHGDFVFGSDGKGTPNHFGVSKKIDVYTSSLSKGLGSFGGYVSSKKNVFRGFHFQTKNKQSKFVNVVKGKILDVAVDIRYGSPSFLKWHAELLTSKNSKMMVIPEGFAHGFQVLTDSTDFEYKCTSYYDPEDEVAIRWDDPFLNIPWPIETPELSEKDSKAQFFRDINI